MEFKTLNKDEVLELYEKKCAKLETKAHPAFTKYLEDTVEESDVVDVVIHGNNKLYFNNRVKDLDLIAISGTLEEYAVYIEEVDLRFNQITCDGAKSLASLLKYSERLLGLNLQGNSIKVEGAQELAEALKECKSL